MAISLSIDKGSREKQGHSKEWQCVRFRITRRLRDFEFRPTIRKKSGQILVGKRSGFHREFEFGGMSEEVSGSRSIRRNVGADCFSGSYGPLAKTAVRVDNALKGPGLSAGPV